MNTSNDQDDFSNSGPASREGSVNRQVVLKDNRMDSRDLFATHREITIAHGDEIYRLRLTAQNKLILTK